MRYELVQRWTGGKGPVAISQADFEAIREAKKGVIQAMFIEEKLDILLDNYIEYEDTLLQLTLRSAVFEEYEYSDSRNAVQRVNRRLANLLTTARVYVDQVPHELSAFNDPTLRQAFEEATNVEYDGRLGYATMEALRNYYQHRGLPVRGISYRSEWVPPDTREWRRHVVEATVPLEELEGNPKFSRSFREDVLPRLREKGDKLDVRELGRDYISGIGAVHRKLRELIAPRVQTWDARLLSTLEDYKAKTGAKLNIRVEALAIDDDGNVTEVIQVFAEPIERRQALERKNRNVGHLTRMLLTS